MNIDKILSKPVWCSSDVAAIIGVSLPTARAIMSSQDFPAIKAYTGSTQRSRLYVEKEAFFSWARSQKN